MADDEGAFLLLDILSFAYGHDCCGAMPTQPDQCTTSNQFVCMSTVMK
jgi:hypothetical protein